MGQTIKVPTTYTTGYENSELFRRFACVALTYKRRKSAKDPLEKFVDLNLLPTELALTILSNLDATDLCLASCVWRELAFDEMLWQRTAWPYCSLYKRWREVTGFSFRQLYLRLDEFRLTFNADCFEGVRYLYEHEIVDNMVDELIEFFNSASGLDKLQLHRFLNTRLDILDGIVQKRNFANQFLPNALRTLLHEFYAPSSGPVALDYISIIIDFFSDRFAKCNSQLGLSPEVIYILCFSLIMLSVDLWNPHIKNKMSKREFIRNTRHAASLGDDDLLGHLYDNVYTVGHIASTSSDQHFSPSSAQVKPRVIH